jgi:hypothetical protein
MLYAPHRPRASYQVAGEHREHSFTVVDVEPERLSFRQVGVKDNVIDRWELRKDAGQAAAR